MHSTHDEARADGVRTGFAKQDVGADAASGLDDRDLVHLHGHDRAISSVGLRFFDFLHHIHSLDDLAEDRVLGAAGAEPIKARVIDGVDEKLARSAVWLSGVRHRERARLVREPRGVLVLDRPTGSVPGAGARALRVLAVGAAELEHEAVDHAVKMQAVVKAALRELGDVARSERHLVHEELDRDGSERGVENCFGVCHRRER